MEKDFPRVVTRDELRFDIDFAIGQMPKSFWRSWATGQERYSDSARRGIVDRILERFDRYQVRAPAPLESHGEHPKRSEP